MLDPMDRENLLEALRPEAGETFDLAVGTSFSVDLEALMFAPLALALFDAEGPPNPTALLAAIQQNASRLALYCDRAQIRPPTAGQKLFALLEPTLLPVQAPREGAFHPKLWVLRYRDAGGGRRHRVLVLSRNLTHDTSWDLAVRLDEDEAGAPLGRDVAVALAALDEMHPSALARDLATSIGRARFALPGPFDEARLRLLGTRREQGDADPLAEVQGERLLVISPFLTAGRLEELVARVSRGGHLVSRASELERLGRRALGGWRTPLVLHEAADPQGDATGGEVALRGLHAKLVVVDHGERTTWFVGSMNATAAAVRQNVELCLELSGPRGPAGVARLLSTAGGEVRFRDLLREFSPPNDGPAPPDPVQEERERLEEIAAELAAMRLGARVVALDGRYELELRFEGQAPELGTGDRLEARLVSQGRRHPVDLDADPSAQIPVRRKSEISALVAMRFSGRLGIRKELVLFARLEGEPGDRIDSLLLELVPDRRHFALLLFLMLAADDPGAEAGGIARRLIAGGSGLGDRGGLGIPLYEELVRASARDRSRLVAIDDLVERLCRTAEGRARLPEGFAEAWQAFRPLLPAEARR